MGSLIVYLGIEKGVKILICAIVGVLFSLACTGCGVSTPGGYVAGSTSYLAEYNAGGFMSDARRGAK